ncbi:MAG: ribosome biogenesis GTPase Der [Planctomycetes bacterium]|nr:ribosome biogenesis GTPase Der [Planctomycetota bacterium]
MALPVVAIIGRPNVGKSSLLNALAGRMISIVEPTAGVTRDRVSAIVDADDRFFELVDMGGYGIVDSDALSEHVENQIHQGIAAANLALFVVDVREGVMSLDVTIAQLLRKSGLRVILVANKCDSARQSAQAGEFSRLGFGEALCVSATNRVNQTVLMERIVGELEHLPAETPEKEVMKIALVGKRNAGKSTLINAICGQDRVIVSEIPGTTRDAVDVRFEKDGKVFVAIDTAGVRKKGKMSGDIEFYSYVRATRSITRADVILFLIDSTLKVSQIDKKLARFIEDEYKPCIIVINKWDLAKDFADTEDYSDYLGEVLPGLRHVPIAFTTATEGKNVQSVLDLAAELFKQASTRIPTPMLNKAIERLSAERVGGSRKKGGNPRIYYGTQVAVRPISLLLFVNRPELFDEPFERFATGRLREWLDIQEVPIRLLLRARR